MVRSRAVKRTRAKIPRELLSAVQRYGPQRAILFGSAARGERDAFSDFDLLMVKETTQPFIERLVSFTRLLPPRLPRVDAFIYTPEEFARMRSDENPIVSAALEDGITIYEEPRRRA